MLDVFALRIVGWQLSRSTTPDFVLDALEQALYARQPERDGSLVHHSDRSSQYVSIRYRERLAEAGAEPPVGSGGARYDNALAETINGLQTAEGVHRRGPWKTRERSSWQRWKGGLVQPRPAARTHRIYIPPPKLRQLLPATRRTRRVHGLHLNQKSPPIPEKCTPLMWIDLDTHNLAHYDAVRGGGGHLINWAKRRTHVFLCNLAIQLSIQ